jgi:hypothetical protein
VVPAADAASDDIEAVPILGAGHSDIVKPSGPEAEIVTTLARFLREAGFRSYESRPDDDGRAVRPSL